MGGGSLSDVIDRASCRDKMSQNTLLCSQGLWARLLHIRYTSSWEPRPLLCGPLVPGSRWVHKIFSILMLHFPTVTPIFLFRPQILPSFTELIEAGGSPTPRDKVTKMRQVVSQFLATRHFFGTDRHHAGTGILDLLQQWSSCRQHRGTQ